MYFEHLAQAPLPELRADIVLAGYQHSYFPMAEADGDIYWHSPDPRAVIPLDGIKISRSLRKTLEKSLFDIRINTAFPEVIRSCCERQDTWISDEIIRVYTELHERGYAHSVETWLDGNLVGGLYGVALGGAFFGESMFSRVSDASKVAFVALTQRLREAGFFLLDTQYINHFTLQLGAVEIPRSLYLEQLQFAMALQCCFAYEVPLQCGMES